MYQNFFFLFAEAIENCCHYSGTSAGTAGKGFTASPFPYTHLQRMVIDHADKFRIHPIREQLMMFKRRTDFLQIQRIHFRQKHNCMRISHRNAGHCVFLTVHCYWLCNKPFQIRIDRNFSRNEDCLSHIHFDAFNLVVGIRIQCQILDAGVCFQRNFCFVSHTHVVNILADASGGIAAHHCFRAVSIKNPHSEICNF